MFKISSLFLFAVLVLGIGAYSSSAYYDSSNILSDSALVQNVFAQSDSDDDSTDDRDEIEIEVETEDDTTKIKIEINGEETMLEFEGFPEDKIISSIINATGLTEDEIRDIWEIESNDDAKEKNDENKKDKDDFREQRLSEKQARLDAKQLERLEKQEQKLADREAKFAEKEQKALERTEKLIQKLESKIQQLEDRVQGLMERLDSGEYYGNIKDKDTEPKSFILSFNGTASQISNSTNQSNVDAEIFLTSQVTKDEVKKLRVDGGEIVVDDVIYDIVFGKARSSSSGQGNENDSLVIIGQTSNLDTGEITTVKLTIDLDSPIPKEMKQDSIDVFVLSPQSKIASEWFLSGEGILFQNT